MRRYWLVGLILALLLAIAGFWFWRRRQNWVPPRSPLPEPSGRWREQEMGDRTGYWLEAGQDQPLQLALDGETNGLWSSWGVLIGERMVPYRCLSLVNRSRQLSIDYCLPRDREPLIGRGYRHLPAGAVLAQVKKGDRIYLFFSDWQTGQPLSQKQIQDRWPKE